MGNELSTSRIPRPCGESKTLITRHHALDLNKSRRYLASVGNVCLWAADTGDPKEVIAALDILRRMPMAVPSLEVSL